MSEDKKKLFEELAKYREQRLPELQEFINQRLFQGVMDKTVGFLTDKSSTGLRLSVTTGSESYTDGKRIVIGMEDYFFDPQFTQSDWVAIHKALLAHEVQHVNSSNFSDIKKIGQEYIKVMAGKGLPDKLLTKIGRDMLNILEDGRIENIIVHKYPGYKMPFLLLNQSHLVLSELTEAAGTPGEEFTDFINSTLCYVETGRLPVGIAVYAGTRFETEFKKIQPLCDLAIDARTSGDCRAICLRVLRLTADYFADLLKSAADEMMAQMAMEEAFGGQGSEYVTSNEVEYNDSPNGSPAEQAEASDKAGDGKEGKGKGSKPGDKKAGKPGDKGKGGKGDGKEDGKDADGSSSGKDGENKTGRNEIRKNMDPRSRSSTEHWADDFSGEGVADDYGTVDVSPELLAALRRGVKDEMDAIEEEEERKNKKPRDPEMDKIQERYKGEYIRTFSELFPAINNGPIPSEIEIQGRNLERALERVIRVKRTERRNMRVGQICSRDLYRVGMNDPHIFMRKGQPMKADMAVFLLGDNSGSMSSQGAKIDLNGHTEYACKSNLARIASAIIERGLSKFAAIKVSLFDVSGGVIRHSTIKKFDERVTNNNKCYNSIKDVGIGGGNKDGYSIRVATKDLMARREARKILVVLSDGLPSDYNGGERAGMNDVKEAVKEARRKGIIVIPIMFGPVSDRERLKDNFAYMYGKFISCDPADITEDFKKLFTKLVMNA